MNGSVDDLLRYYAEVEPQQLDALEVSVRRETDDPAWSAGKLDLVQQARARTLDRIAEARQLVRQ